MNPVSARGAPAPSAFVRYGNFLFRRRNAVFPAVMFGLFVLLEPRPFLGDWRLDPWLDALGLLVCLLGQAFRVLVIGLAYIKRGGVNKRIFASKLVTAGMFQVCRNPLYVGNGAVLAGLFLIHNNPWAYALGALFYLVSYAAMVAAEERYLRGQFGAEYADYCRQVNRWLPKAAAIPAALRSMAFNLPRVVIKEYGSFFIWVGTAVFLFAHQKVAREGFDALPSATALFAAAAAVSAGLAGIVRALKKKGVLRDPLA
jgi:protein-S-isoprenylcysteine O-methyltransferase Ste14